METIFTSVKKTLVAKTSEELIKSDLVSQKIKDTVKAYYAYYNTFKFWLEPFELNKTYEFKEGRSFFYINGERIMKDSPFMNFFIDSE